MRSPAPWILHVLLGFALDKAFWCCAIARRRRILWWNSRRQLDMSDWAIGLACELYWRGRARLNRFYFSGEIGMFFYGIARQCRIARALRLAALFSVAAIGVGCGGAISSSQNQPNRDPLHLGASPGPLGTVIPQTIELRLGSEPSDRIVSLSLTANTLQAVNSGSGLIDLLTAPVTFEFASNAIVTQPVFLGQIYEDTYSAIVFPATTGQVVFVDVNGQLATQ